LNNIAITQNSDFCLSLGEGWVFQQKTILSKHIKEAPNPPTNFFPNTVDIPKTLPQTNRERQNYFLFKRKKKKIQDHLQPQ
jgi:hypothetical protein